MSKLHIVTVVGARPQFIKAAALSSAIATTEGMRESIVHTGQHYNPALSDVFFRELSIPAPALSLNVGSGSHGAQTGEMLTRLEQAFLALHPDVVVLYGDTNSTLAGALAASKLRIPTAHVEAGLRSFNRAMPEEINRVLTDHVSDLLFCPTKTAVANLAREGIERGVLHVGDVMYDLSVRVSPLADAQSSLRDDPRLRGGYIAATIHRAENTDFPERLARIFDGLKQVATQRAVILPLHPRTKAALSAASVDTTGLTITEPLGFLDMTYLLRHAAAVVTDSGGVQKEVYFHRVPCVTVRSETEWVETVDSGWNRLASPDDAAGLAMLVERVADSPRPTTTIADYGSGNSCAEITTALKRLSRNEGD